MGRPPRIDTTETWHHVTNHRIENGDLWADDDDRYLTLRLLRRAAAIHKIDIACVSFMGNHWHLVVYCPTACLSDFMHSVASNYARIYNHRHGRRGHLFTGRYHNVPITDDAQLLATTRYVDRNPLELGYDITTYPFSSYGTYVGLPTEPSRILDIRSDVPLRLAGGRANYARLVATDQPSDKFRFIDGRRKLIASPPTPIEDALMSVAEIVADLAGCSPATVIAPSPGSRNPARLASMLVAYECGVATSKELRDFFGYKAQGSVRGALTRARRLEKADHRFRELVDSASQAWSRANRIAS